MTDPLIRRIKKKPDFIRLLEKAWGIFYFEGSGPDIGIRRESFFKEALKEELGLKIREAPTLERQVDFYIQIDKKWHPYSLKTMESIGTLKVSWNSFPDVERLREAARSFKFKAPIIFIYRNGICVFEVEDLERVRRELGFASFWAIPRQEVNPRGFGIRSGALRKLIEIAKQKGNFIEITGERIEDENARKEYFKRWFKFIKEFIKDLPRILSKSSLKEYM